MAIHNMLHGDWRATMAREGRRSNDLSGSEIIDAEDWWNPVLSASPNFRQVEVTEDSRLLGRIQYFVRRSRPGFKWGRNPDWSIPRPLRIDRGLAPEQKADVIERLIKQLPADVSFYLVFEKDGEWSSEILDAFTRHGFEYACVPTYEWKPENGDVLDGMKSKSRSQLKLAQKQLDVTEIGGDLFLSFYGSNLALEKNQPVRPLALAGDLLNAAHAHKRVRITAARRRFQSGSYDAAIACAWDSNCYYYWMSTYRPTTRNYLGGRPHKDAVKVLILDAMLHAKSLGLIFDTDGIGSAGSEHLYRDILRMSRADIRLVFKRASKLVACYEKYRPLMLRLMEIFR